MKIIKPIGFLISIIGLALLLNALHEIGFTVAPEPQLGPDLGRGGFVINHYWLETKSFQAIAGLYLLIVGFGLFNKISWFYHPSIIFFIPVSAYLTRRIIDHSINTHGIHSFMDYFYVIVVVIMWSVSLWFFKRR